MTLPRSTPAAAARTSRPGIDRRLEQRQLPHDALDVHAVADLEEPIGDRVPVLVELRVGRRAEVLRGHAEHGAGRRRCPGAR